MDRRSAYLPFLISAALIMGAPLLIDDRFVIKVLSFVGLNVITVVGLSILFGYAGQISLGHAAFLGIGAYTSAYVTAVLDWPWLSGVAAGALLAGTGGLLLALPSLRLKGHYLAMATLGFGEIMFVLFVEAEAITGGVDGFTGIPFASIGSFEFRTPAQNYWLVWGVALIVILLVMNMVRLRPGRAMRALHGSELGARACGVDIVRVKVEVFVFSAVLAGISGALYAHMVGFISPSLFTLHTSVILVAMTVLGGTSSLAGPILAAAGLTLLPYIDAIIPGVPSEVAEFIQDWEADIYGLTIILVMLFAPDGVAGLLRSIRRRVALRRGGEGS
jgi:branched-chain amino acid transport system permease protein